MNPPLITVYVAQYLFFIRSYYFSKLYPTTQPIMKVIIDYIVVTRIYVFITKNNRSLVLMNTIENILKIDLRVHKRLTSIY